MILNHSSTSRSPRGVARDGLKHAIATKNTDMRHQWEKIKNFKPHDDFYEQQKCKSCGMIKTKCSFLVRGKRVFDSTMERSGQLFGLNSSANYIPECIDWSDNTLD